jgi:hypothetical protein
VTAEVDIANRALSSIGTRSQITDLTEDPTARSCVSVGAFADELLRMAPWNCATNFNNEFDLCPRTPENPSAGASTWQRESTTAMEL